MNISDKSPIFRENNFGKSPSAVPTIKLGQVDITRRYASAWSPAIDRMLPIIITGDCTHKSPLGGMPISNYSNMQFRMQISISSNMQFRMAISNSSNMQFGMPISYSSNMQFGMPIFSNYSDMQFRMPISYSSCFFNYSTLEKQSLSKISVINLLSSSFSTKLKYLQSIPYMAFIYVDTAGHSTFAPKNYKTQTVHSNYSIYLY